MRRYNDMRPAKVVRDKDGAVVRCPKTARAYRRAFSGSFGREKPVIAEYAQ